MKVPSITNTSNISIVKRIKNVFVNCKLKLQTLTKDVFERQKNKYIIVDGKKYRARDWPNCAGRPNDYIGAVATKVKFYPEDEAIMAKMKTAREQIEYASKLIDEGKFIK